jgi:hypothetical protein
MYRLGMPETSRSPNAERQQEEEDFDPSDYTDYQPPTEAFMKRFCPRQHDIEQAATRPTHTQTPTDRRSDSVADYTELPIADLTWPPLRAL